MEPKFNSLDELKLRIMPALKVRKRELKKININITEEELWNYFVDKYWKKANNLSLAKMVDHILNEEVVIGVDYNE